MKAIVITTPGDAGVLQVTERPRPISENDEVLIKVYAAGINRPDVTQRKGNYPPPPGASPDIPGLEVAGIIADPGAQKSLKKGDRVCALLTGGGYAEYCTAPAGQCLPIPENLSFTEAASLPETFFTVWSNVFDRGRLQPGESFLVHGGTSGIGVAAIQLAKAWGAFVYTTAGTDQKCAYCETLGADKAVNYNTQSFKEVIMHTTEQKGIDVILDMIGGDYTPDNLELLANDGRLVLINFMKGDKTNIRLSQIMKKRLTITGSTLRARDVNFKSNIAANLQRHVWPLLEQGKVKPVVYKTFPLAQASAAHELMESSAHIGKIVLEINHA